jgi:hypothetical protein
LPHVPAIGSPASRFENNIMNRISTNTAHIM